MCATDDKRNVYDLCVDTEDKQWTKNLRMTLVYCRNFVLDISRQKSVH